VISAGAVAEHGPCQAIGDYMTKLTDAERAKLLIPDETLAKPWMVRVMLDQCSARVMPLAIVPPTNAFNTPLPPRSPPTRSDSLLLILLL
jgi:hypothetical protein